MGDIHTAKALFRKPFRINESNQLAHHGYACVLALRRKGKFICDLDHVDDSCHHLVKSIKTESSRRERLAMDTNLNAINDFSFFANLMLDPSFLMGKFVSSVPVWYEPRPGVCPGYPEVHLLEKVIVQISFLRFLLNRHSVLDQSGKWFSLLKETPSQQI